MLQRKFLRFALAVSALVVCASARQAAAQLGSGGTNVLTGSGGTTGTTTTLTTSDFFVGIQAQQGVNLTTFDSARFFNIARCECNTPVYLFVSLQQSGFAKRAQVLASVGNIGIISVWLGSTCTNVLNQGDANLCKKIASQSLSTFLNQGSWELTTDARTLSTPLDNTVVTADGGTTSSADPCAADTYFNQIVQVLLDYNGDGSPDFNVTDQVYIDLHPPPPPTEETVTGGNEALIARWTQVDQAVVNDLLGYQVLCSRADAYQVFKETPNDAGGSNGPYSASFVTCPTTQAADAGVEGLNPTYVCSPLLSAISTSYRVEVLQNDITYAMSVVAIDNSGNASKPEIHYGKPIKTSSFYEVYRDGYAASNNTGSPDPGGASGGFCAVAVRRPGWRSGLGALSLVGIGAALGLARRRRRQGRR